MVKGHAHFFFRRLLGANTYTTTPPKCFTKANPTQFFSGIEDDLHLIIPVADHMSFNFQPI